MQCYRYHAVLPLSHDGVPGHWCASAAIMQCCRYNAVLPLPYDRVPGPTGVPTLRFNAEQ